MRFTRWSLALVAGSAYSVAAGTLAVESSEPVVQAAAFNQSPAEPDDAAQRALTAQRFAHGAGGDPKALAQVIQLTRGLKPTDAATALDELAAAHQRVGHLTLAADVRRTLVAQFPQEPLAATSVLWLVRLYSSSEIGYASRQDDPGKQAIAQQMASTNPLAVATKEDRNAATGSAVVAAYGLHLANEAARANPKLDADPALRFQRFIAARRAGDAKAANKFLAPLNRADAAEPWGACARAEAWLASPAEVPAPKPTLACPAAVAPPQLDGHLDEPFWQGEATAALGDAEVRIAYDDRFLYVAVRAAKHAGLRYDADSRPRAHDADLSQSDRVRLLIDLDRDYATWFELTVDSRGRTADRCGEDAAWNPEWYVAAGETPGEARFDSTELAEVSEPDANGKHWTIEAAIPFASLTDHPPAPGAAWACAMERLAPNATPQSWSGQPADQPAPMNFGLLLFQ